MAVAIDLTKALDKGFESSNITEILDAPVSALSGVTKAHAEHLAADFNIKTVRDLGTNKFYALAASLVTLEAHQG
ncbi:hypothetical protein [Kineosporia sp. NBRC 101731]|uniref:hypothetical protein n=1 Tax=Kineosporia sp. NBRC 101731 TaxID=3032199 RepID=UPI0024A240C6|nr:hypothetical protein [Kineosporia sp. NBRC 101731]GLY32558.1 hypothetical protein Kisp02_59230 [Kineosporia sp. NBRC 101731]